MRDIPLFTTENGVASLLFKKIPYTKEAFVHIRDSRSFKEFIKECKDICVMAGAEEIYATGHDDLPVYPEHCAVVCYKAQADSFPETEAIAVPISSEQMSWWRQVYNQKMVHVPSAAPLSESDVERLIAENKAYCIYKACSAVGIGVAYDGEVQAVASIAPGCGRDCVIALEKCLGRGEVSLSVASTNMKAIDLYKRLGFKEMETKAVWYKIF